MPPPSPHRSLSVFCVAPAPAPAPAPKEAKQARKEAPVPASDYTGPASGKVLEAETLNPDVMNLLKSAKKK